MTARLSKITLPDKPTRIFCTQVSITGQLDYVQVSAEFCILNNPDVSFWLRNMSMIPEVRKVYTWATDGSIIP